MIFSDTGIIGVDISTHQDAPDTPLVVDFQQMRNRGASFVIIRAGNGTTEDADFDTHWANSAGILPRAIYWFYNPVFSPQAQAQKCIEVVGNVGCRIWVDLEFTWDGSYSQWSNWKTFITILQNHGYKIGIYTAWDWWRVHAFEAKADLNYFGQFPLWMAHYDVDQNEALVPYGWEVAMIWQIGTPVLGKEFGVESFEIDMNKWNTLFDFVTEWGWAPLERTEIVATKYYLVNTDVLNIRSSAENLGSTNDVGDLKRNDVIRVDSSIGDWGLFVKIWRNGAEIALPVSPTNKHYCSLSLCKYLHPGEGGSVLKPIDITLEQEGYPTVSIVWSPNEGNA